jgi:hypothetical protein
MKIKKENVQKIADLIPSPYNPRKITDKQLSMLKKSMTEFGDLSGIIRNVQTGNLIGGHQRIKNLDPSWPIISQPHTDKTGTIALGYIETPEGRWQYREVDWPEKKEAAANVAANQHGGEFDMPKLREIIIELDDGSLDTELFGFNSHELELMMTAVHQDEPKKEKLTMTDIAEDNPNLAKFIEQREKSRERGKDKNELNFWICLIFQSYDQKTEFIKHLPEGTEIKYEKYVDGEALADALNISVTKNTQKPFTSKVESGLAERTLE